MKTKSDIYKVFEAKSNERRLRKDSAIRVFVILMVIGSIVSALWYKPEYSFYSYLISAGIISILVASIFAVFGWYLAVVDEVSDECSVVSVSKTLSFLDHNIPITESKIKKLEDRLERTKKELDNMKSAQKDSKELLQKFI